MIDGYEENEVKDSTKEIVQLMNRNIDIAFYFFSKIESSEQIKIGNQVITHLLNVLYACIINIGFFVRVAIDVIKKKKKVCWHPTKIRRIE